MSEPRQLAPLITGTPAEITAAQIEAGMTSAARFGPGTPLTPADGYSRTPRSFDYTTGYNISARPRLHERVSFDALRGLVEAYDVAQMCIWHRIDSIRSLNWALVAAPGHEGEDVSDAIDHGTRLFRKPDRVSSLKAILTTYLYDTLAFDSGTLYRIRNGAGQVIGFKPVDGTSIAPLLDYYGDTPNRRLPEDPAPPAFVQFVQGIPWNTLTLDDLIYEPFRPTSNSPYGRAPLETILLNANTDLRFQKYFLDRFTDGNIPHGFAGAPEGWTPDQIREFQDAWDALILGDQAVKQQVKWVPHGTSFAWSNEKEFSDKFSLFLMRKTCAAYHVTPQDLGFTEDVNRATSETQVDNQFRVGDLPLIQHVQEIFDSLLQDDMGLPLAFQFDTGQEKEDRLATAQADKIYVEMGSVSLSEVRERVYGLSEPNGQALPRFIMTSRSGPVPLNALLAVAGQTDPASGAPAPGAPLPFDAFTEVPGTVPSPPLGSTPLAVDERGVEAMPPQPPSQPPSPYQLTAAGGGTEVAKAAVDAELAAFGRFVKARRRAGKWRDFTFSSVDAGTARRLNVTARADVRKAAGELIAAGLCVRAADTGRVLMLQRGYDPADPARGLWEFPGGHIEDGENALVAAVREWQEETGCLIPLDAVLDQTSYGPGMPAWVSGNGIYTGMVLVLPCESAIDIRERGQVTNPDDPDGDVVEAIAWWDPQLLPGNPAIRAELAADIDRVLVAITPPAPAAEVVEVGKAAWRDNPPATPHAEYDLAIVDHYAPLIADAMQNLWTDEQLTAAVHTMAGQVVKGAGPAPLPDPNDAELRKLIEQLVLDALVTGDHAAGVQIGANPILHVSDIDWSAWKPGDSRAADLVADGGLKDLLDGEGIRIAGINDTTLERIGNRIAEGLAKGDAVDTVARGLRGLLGDPFRATVIAHTEMARAMTRATMATYALNGISEWDLLTTGGACAVCLDVEARNPHPVADVDGQPPLHPLCRCAASPRPPTF